MRPGSSNMPRQAVDVRSGTTDMGKSTREFSVAVIAGDGIGKETVPAAMKVIDAACKRYDRSIAWVEHEWGSDYFFRHGRMMPEDGLESLREADAIFFGAVGVPEIPDRETLWGLLMPIRRGFGLSVNVRPVRSYVGVGRPLVTDKEIDLVIVRENVEGEYSDVGEVAGDGENEWASQVSMFTRQGVERVAHFAAELASRRRGILTSATKSNGIIYTMPFWDRIVSETAAAYSGVRLESALVDALCARLVCAPESLDVIVASNLLGDILSDLAAACCGSLGLAASACLNPTREHPPLFEPVHGSAPDIAGLGVANPIGQVLCGAMLLEYLGETQGAADIEKAVAHVLEQGPRTRDVGGVGSTEEVVDAIVAVMGDL